jgi:hypothetical protein
MNRMSDVVRGWLGWCPAEYAPARARMEKIPPHGIADAPMQPGSFKTGVLDWLGLFRNQMIVLALYFSVVGVLLSVFLGGLDLPLFFAGIVAGSLLSVFQGFRFWKTMNEVRDEGAVFLATLYDKTTITITLVVAMIPMAISVGAIPGVNMKMLNSVSGGFIFILFWWCLCVVWLWESGAHRNLLSDGLMLSLAREV